MCMLAVERITHIMNIIKSCCAVHNEKKKNSGVHLLVKDYRFMIERKQTIVLFNDCKSFIISKAWQGYSLPKYSQVPFLSVEFLQSQTLSTRLSILWLYPIERDKILLKRCDLGIKLNCICLWGSNYGEDMEYPFMAITPRSTRNLSSISC